LLLMTPTEHDRFDFYDGSLRKESSWVFICNGF
jgi:hypothetical protein